MLIYNNQKFIQAQFDSEDELEQIVIQYSEYIFGPSSIYLPKKSLIKTSDGAGTVPDGFAIDIATRQWFVIEAELIKHGVWQHIAPQVNKQVIAATQAISKQLLIDQIVERIKSDINLLEKFEEFEIKPIDIRQFLSEILDKRPVVGIPIDTVSNDLRDWASSLKNEVKLWVVRKYVEFGNPQNVLFEIPEEYKPTFDTQDIEEGQEARTFYDVNLYDLLEEGFLKSGDKLLMTYAPKGQKKQVFEALVSEDGLMEVLGQIFSAPSYAALRAIQETGSTRTTVNGWQVWRNENGRLLAELRDQYIAKIKSKLESVG